MGTVGLVLAMLAAVIMSGLVARALPFNLPRPVVQIGFGAFIGAVSRTPVKLDPDVFFLLFLPPLLFLDGWRIPNEGLRRDRGLILQLALGLVFFTVLGMGFFIHWMIPAIPLPAAFALAAIVSPTDPVAVSAIAARVSIPPRVMHRLEGESLLNDASGLVCFRFAVAAAMTGTFSLGRASLTLLQLAVGGLLIGVAVTYGIAWLKDVISRRLGEEAGSQVLISLLIPFAAYEAAEQLNCSGILAAVAAGITMSHAELSGRALAITRMQRTAVWDTLQYALNGVMFVLLGEQLPGILAGTVLVVRQSNHVSPWWLLAYVVAINFGLAVLRFVWVWISTRLSELVAALRGMPSPEKADLRLVAVVSLAGVRGAITLAGVLTLPLALPDGSTFPARELVIFLAAGVIVLSLLAASIALPRLLRGVQPPAERAHEAELDRARVIAAQAAIRAIEETQHDLARGQSQADLFAEAATRIMELYRRRIQGDVRLGGEDAERIRQSEDIGRQLRLAGLRAERDAIFALARRYEISDVTSRRLVREIDLLEERLK
ncbi:MAG TPA: Na+/H+ antiporter [Steroidobacteraceae bacterium]|nr:Na+/H+ antiporter [Steroidobacteraceae bacterium]